MTAKIIPLVGEPGAMRSRAQVEWAKVKRRLERRGFQVGLEGGAIVLTAGVPRPVRPS